MKKTFLLKNSWFKIAVYGLILSLTFFLTFTLLVGILGINNSFINWPVAWLMTIGLSWYFVQFLKIKKMADYFPVFIIWIAISIIVLYLITYKFAGLDLFKNFEIWVNYSLMVLTGFISIKLNSK